MFVSLLQLMGFSAPKPVHSRAVEAPLPDAVPVAEKVTPGKKVRAKTVTSAPTVQEKPARRTPVKAQAVKPKAPTQPLVAAKSVKASKPATPVKAEPVKVKVVKPAIAVASKAASKPAIKPVVKSVPDPVVTSKTPVKPAVQLKVKPAATKQKTSEAVPKAVAKPVPSQSKKKIEEVSIQPPVVSKDAAAPAVAKPAAKSAGPEYQMTPSGVPVRTGRPSSRLAQLTVPSMAQSVASTAAKASFSQIKSVQPIAPPLASAVKKDPKLANNWKTKPVAELTDADVIAMSDEVYMNATQLAFFRLKLVALKNDILSSAGETTEHLREDTVVVPDPADRATIEEEHALELRTRDRERKLLKKIEQSIDLIDAGEYGYCDETGEPIGVGRLIARPTATLSLEAQQRRELKQKMFGD
jgi:DnaK suppressor protein